LDIIFTDVAADNAKEFLKRGGRVDASGNPLCGLRLQIRGSDAFGVRYVFSVDCNEPRSDDKVIESNGFKLFVDFDTYAYLSEISETLRIDHQQSAEYSGFRISFPEKTITLETEEKPIPQPGGIRLRRPVIAGLLILVLVLGFAAGRYGTIITPTTTASYPPSKVVNIDVIPDWGGPGYDAFVLSTNGTAPRLATNTTSPGPNDNNITVTAGVPVTFVITNIDTAINENFTGPVSTNFTIYNDTASGQVASQYIIGQSVTNLRIGHTFSIPDLNVNIPIPPDTIVIFTYTFTSSGVYSYLCTAPCGPGMGLRGYMLGYLTVT
jgi:Fe-S cluster assembly iron-binding protein IscA